MNKLLATLGVGALAMLFGFIPLAVEPAAVSGADDDSLWKPFLAESDFNKIVESEVKLIQDEMKKPKADAHKIRGSAIVIALAAQNTKDAADPKQVATVRDMALKLTSVASSQKESKALADSLTNFKQVKSDPQANSQPVDLKKHIEENRDGMRVLGPTNKSGEGIEKEFLTLGGQRKPLSPAQMSEKLVMMAYKSALLAEVARAHPERAETKKKEWLQWTDKMRRASLELAETTKAKKPKEVKSALSKLNASCNDCHGTFTEK